MPLDRFWKHIGTELDFNRKKNVHHLRYYFIKILIAHFETKRIRDQNGQFSMTQFFDDGTKDISYKRLVFCR